jgi:hypothetical protein
MTNLTHNSFVLCLLQFSTCFEQPRAHHQENQLYQYSFWYMSFCVGGRLVCRSGRNDIYQKLYWYNWFSWWWERGCSKHVENCNKHTKKGFVRQVGYLSELYQYVRSTKHKILIPIFMRKKCFIVRCSTISDRALLCWKVLKVSPTWLTVERCGKVKLSVEHWWNDTGGSKPKYSKENLSRCHFDHNKYHTHWS